MVLAIEEEKSSRLQDEITGERRRAITKVEKVQLVNLDQLRLAIIRLRLQNASEQGQQNESTSIKLVVNATSHNPATSQSNVWILLAATANVPLVYGAPAKSLAKPLITT